MKPAPSHARRSVGEGIAALLGAYGHPVALREGDLAYLHVHRGEPSRCLAAPVGPAVPFAATAPTAGRYPLYLDFKVDDTVHTATFVVDAGPGGRAQPAAATDGRRRPCRRALTNFA